MKLLKRISLNGKPSAKRDRRLRKKLLDLQLRKQQIQNRRKVLKKERVETLFLYLTNSFTRREWFLLLRVIKV